MDYGENFFNIKYEAKRGEVLKITADQDESSLSCYDGILHLMNNDMCGRTALFSADCDFFFSQNKIIIHVHQGTPSYMKELSKLRKLTTDEYKLHNLKKLW